KCFFLLHMLGIALIAGACGAVEDTTETATEYISKGYSVESGAAGTQQTEAEEAFSFSNKVLGNLTEKSVKLIKNTVVYVKPDKNSAQLGTLEKGTKVKAVGKTEKDEWLMVNYNGRVAYIKSNSIDGDELSSVEEAVEEDSDSRGHGSTANGNNSDTNSGGTGNTVKKPSNTNNGNAGNTGGTGSSSGNGTITPSEPSNGSDDSNSGGNTSETEKPSQPSTEPVTPITPSEPDTSVTPTEPDNPVTPPTESDNSSEGEESLDGE
ncbi:SH3 domain-containing protein, partial [Agathobacter rectalis]